MPMAMLVTLVGITLSASLVPLVVNQVLDTRNVAGRTEALQAAQTGIDVALGQLRSGAGNIELLPSCDLAGVAKSVQPNVTSSYTVRIDYFIPSDTTPVPAGCDLTTLIVTPVYAKLTATGTAPKGSIAGNGSRQMVTRTLEAIYTFKTSNANIAGGAMQLASPTVLPLCMDSGADQFPAAGSVAKVQLCKLGGSSDQRFAYTTDLNIKVVGSETTDAPAGMCLEADYPRSNNNPVYFQPCLGLVAKQQWSLNDSSSFSGTRETQVKLNEFCLSVQNPGVAGSSIVLGNCNSAANRNVFRPQPGTGAGMASEKTGQLVNFKQFSRCLDVTNFKPDWDYMIVWFCKQAPDGTVPWNQHWNLPSQATSDADAELKAGLMWTSSSSTAQRYCLRSSGVPNSYVTMTACDTTVVPTDQGIVWKVYGNTGDYTTSYRIKDSYGYCMTPTDLTATPPDTHTDGTAKVKVVECGKSELQKWNAPADLNKPLALSNTTEK